jgi:AcrR family transcriptional regulator
MDKKIENTEQRILEAAKFVFHRRGFDGARMQDIADEAGINKALVHYYFRSKDNLFLAVFEDAFSILIGRVNEIFFTDQPIKVKVSQFLDYYIGFLSEHSYIPHFILNSLYERPEELKKILEKKQLSPVRLMALMKKQAKEELNLDIDPFQFYINILALVIFPVIARPLIQTIFGYSDIEMQQFYTDRRKAVPEFILNALKGYEQAD